MHTAAGGAKGGSGGMRGAKSAASPHTQVAQHASGAMLHTRSQRPKPLARLQVTLSPSRFFRISSLSSHRSGGGGGDGAAGGGGGARGVPSGGLGEGGGGSGSGGEGGGEGGRFLTGHLQAPQQTDGTNSHTNPQTSNGIRSLKSYARPSLPQSISFDPSRARSSASSGVHAAPGGGEGGEGGGRGSARLQLHTPQQSSGRMSHAAGQR